MEHLQPSVWAEVDRLIRGQKMIDAIKHLSASRVDQQTAKEMVERLQRKVELDAALAREEWLDAVVQRLGAETE